MVDALRDIEDIPQNLIAQVTDFLMSPSRTRCSRITGNLAGLMNRSGVGTCAGAANFLTMNHFRPRPAGFPGKLAERRRVDYRGLQAARSR